MDALLIDSFYAQDYPELIREIATEIFVHLVESEDTRHLGEAVSARIAFTAGERIRQEFGGTNWYIGKGVQYTCSARDREIFERDRGNNIDELARAYDLTPMRIRQILKRCRIDDQRRRQASLFEADGTGENVVR
jgi:Mor family transcriptional regulator